jgi:hypothetical protein
MMDRIVPDDDDLPEVIPTSPRTANPARDTGGIAGSSSASAVLVISRASDIHPEPIRWLWQQRIAIGKQTLLAGEPGLGKSQLTCWIAAAVTTAGFWPGNSDRAPLGSVIILWRWRTRCQCLLRHSATTSS